MKERGLDHMNVNSINLKQKITNRKSERIDLDLKIIKNTNIIKIIKIDMSSIAINSIKKIGIIEIGI